MNMNAINLFAEKVINDTLNTLLKDEENLISVIYEINEINDTLYFFIDKYDRTTLENVTKSFNIYSFPVLRYVEILKPQNTHKYIYRHSYYMLITDIVTFLRNEGLKYLLK